MQMILDEKHVKLTDETSNGGNEIEKKTKSSERAQISIYANYLITRDGGHYPVLSSNCHCYYVFSLSVSCQQYILLRWTDLEEVKFDLVLAEVDALACLAAVQVVGHNEQG